METINFEENMENLEKIVNKYENKIIKKKIEEIDLMNTTPIKALNLLYEIKEDLKKAIKEERYEDAAKIRDEIKKMEEKKNESK